MPEYRFLTNIGSCSDLLGSHYTVTTQSPCIDFKHPYVHSAKQLNVLDFQSCSVHDTDHIDGYLT